jgi:Na+-transporting methylmalonyl-CoA/oxaloacetate decarboxylase gamma subunit
LSLIAQGLSLSIAAISITFAAFGLLILVMIVLERVFRAEPSVSDSDGPEETQAVSTLASDPVEEEVVAAISAAMAHLGWLGIYPGGLGKALEAGRSSWWVMGQLRQRTQKTWSLVKASPTVGTSLPAGTSHAPEERR